jgi:hypothetical protein
MLFISRQTLKRTVSQQWKYQFFYYFTKRNGSWIRKFFSGSDRLFYCFNFDYYSFSACWLELNNFFFIFVLLIFKCYLFLSKICLLTIYPPIFLVEKSAHAKSTDGQIFLPIFKFKIFPWITRPKLFCPWVPINYSTRQQGRSCCPMITRFVP